MASVVLGIETSCDETGVALVDGDRRILAEAVRTQLDEHALYGGVVPEIAARAHVESLDRLIASVMADAGLDFPDLAAVAATAGPGLIGGLLVGLTTAKAICLVHDLPLIAVNHLEAHALTARLTDDVTFPYLLLLVSGGHCQLVQVDGLGNYRRLGTTVDDALGEAFDKVAKMLGLGFPGGPAVERAAASGDPTRFPFPRPMLGRPGCSFSFSGLKTAVRQTVLALGEEAAASIPDICASFQAAVAETVADRTRQAIGLFRQNHPDVSTCLVVAGGVAANGVLRAALKSVAAASGATLVVPPPRLCTDNGTMIAWAGIEHLREGHVASLDTPARARWPLDPDAEPALGGGAKGAKA
ncbi:MAG TPA: tRNA (adenosine(37)-N6)-threonylcarbamoyltransferase complex transferase subunit TsaD [Geminicoccus sp.]|uniref:tRNA (adenosine(37)-N6)-threonylcarbamoyltransferase complex transferase subunit TsaD n=1 Tax=Geminicoccus sp. TaxID=2024832 RepID=UPI002E36A36D|nr:tRNA (adenosine(37)-N6)-threonylcarbamoyltransferase complex transferase subunit TsaD [Geminicoccus sp.]HEX2526945.1 tRNA (adenosine(37)-N6)-threonylcarbamoyltransferase complex transferase subunit TsaD [Geminicoccus sp.]